MRKRYVPLLCLAIFVKSFTAVSGSLPETISVDLSDLAGSTFGYSTAVCGDTAVIGEIGDDDQASNAGAVYVFVRETYGLWTQQAKLYAADPAASDCLGTSVSIDGDTIVVGAYKADPDGTTDAGAAYVFVRDGTTWSQQAKLTADDGLASDFFGRSVSVDGDTIVVGADGADPTYSAEGAAYVFVRSGTTWSQQAKLTAGDPVASAKLGYSVSVDGDTALIGAYLAKVDGAVVGAAYVFTRSDTTWSEEAKLTAGDDVVIAAYFGYSVSLSGDTALVGASEEDGTHSTYNDKQGAAYVFTRSGTTWSREARFDPEDFIPVNEAIGMPYTKDFKFGISVAVSGDALLIGSPGNGVYGTAYLYTRSGSAWSRTGKFAQESVTGFGKATALDGNTALVGTGSGGHTFVLEPKYPEIDVQRPGFDSIADGGTDSLGSQDTGPVVLTYTIENTGTGPLTIEDGAVTFTNQVNCSNFQVINSLPLVVASDSRATLEIGFDVDTAAAFSFDLQIANDDYDEASYDITVNSDGTSDTTEEALPEALWDIITTNERTRQMSLSGDTLVVGMPYDDTLTGAVGVLVRSPDGSWSRQAKLYAGDPEEQAYFGWSVSIDGDTLVVGAFSKTAHDTSCPIAYEGYEIGDSPSAGAAYVFTRTGETWTQQAKLMSDDPYVHKYFGIAVAVSGETILVGEPAEGTYLSNTFVFVRESETWSQQAKLNVSDAADGFGGALDLDGDTALIGGTSLGTAYVYTRSGTTWTQQQELPWSNPQSYGLYGSQVSLDGDTAVVGAPFTGGSGTIEIEVSVFTRSDTTWSEEAVIDAGDGCYGDSAYFQSVAVDGDVLLIGSRVDDPAAVTGCGTVGVYTREGTTWSKYITHINDVFPKLDAYTASDKLGNYPDYYMGMYVALEGSTAVTSAYSSLFTYEPDAPGVKPWQRPGIDVQRPADTSIAEDDTDDVGTQKVGVVTLTYTIVNTGFDEPMTVSAGGVTASNLSNCSGFTVNTDLPLSVAAGGSESLEIELTVDSGGAFGLDLELASNAYDNATYGFSISGTGDVTAPTVTPTGTTALESTSVTLKFASDEAGTYYYLVYAAADAAPDAATVKAQGTAVAKGTAAAVAGANTADVTGLTAETAYKAYVIVEDAVGNVSAVATIAFTTKGPTYLYWAQYGSDSIGRGAVDGSAKNAVWITGCTDPKGVAVNGEYVYWTNAGSTDSIGRAKLDGSEVNQSFITGCKDPISVTVDETYIYWANSYMLGTSIGRAKLDGSEAAQDFVTCSGTPTAVVVDSTYIYWADQSNDKIMRRLLIDGDSGEEFYSVAAYGLTLDDEYLYWTNPDTGYVGRIKLVKTSPESTWIYSSTYFPPYGIAVDEDKVYWSVFGSYGSKICYANLASPTATSLLTSLNTPYEVALAVSPKDPEIDVQRPAATSIADGGTDAIGNQNVGTVTVTYTIDNSEGGVELTIAEGGVTASNLSNCSGFTVNTALPLTVVVGSSGSLEIECTVDALGAFSFDLDIVSNDSDETTYDIAVSGTGTAPEIDVQRPADTSIVDGGTDTLGNCSVGTVTVTYTIDNSSGTGTLTIGEGGVTASNLSNCSGFTVNTALPLTVAGGSSETLEVEFTVTATGVFSFDLDIVSDDSDETTYDIAVSGTGTAPEIDVQRPADSSIADGGTDAIGNKDVGTVTLTYTIDNSSGTGTLTIGEGGVTASNLSNCSGFTVNTTLPLAVAAGGSETLEVEWTVDAGGAFSFDLDIVSNDSDETTYDIAVSGTGVLPEIDVQRPADTSIADGGTDAVGNQNVGTVAFTYTIDNSAGAGTLTIASGAVTASNLSNCSGFKVNTLLPLIVAAGETESLEIECTVDAEGAFSFDLDIVSNDSDEATYDIAVSGTGVANEAPTALTLSNTVTSISGGKDTSTRIKMADITVTDDGKGTNDLSVSGDDAALFEIYDGDLYLVQGAVLDYEANPQLDVTVEVDDASVGNTPDASDSLSVTVLYFGPGAVDPNFGTDGIVTADLTGSAADVAFQADGKVLVTGNCNTGDGFDFVVVRYNPDGTLDTTFGPNQTGVVVTDINGDDYSNAVAVDADGKILVAGYTSTNGSDFAVVRYNTDGTVDTSFGSDSRGGSGIVSTDIASGSVDMASDMVIDGDGNILLAGYTSANNNDFALIRYTPDGRLDTTFGPDSTGIVTTDIGNNSTDICKALAVDDEGNSVLVGISSQDVVNIQYVIAVARYDSDGIPDTNFDSDGIVTADFTSGEERAYAVVLQDTGQILVAGSSYQDTTSADFTLLRYNLDGTLDDDSETGFGADHSGIVVTPTSPSEDHIYGLTVQVNGKIIAAGPSDTVPQTRGGGTNFDFGLACYNSDGTLYTSFGEEGTGIVVTDLQTDNDVANSVAINPDGNILLVGGTGSGSAESFALVLFTEAKTTPVTVTGATATNKTYDGNTDATVSGGELSGVEDGDNVTLENSTGGTFASAGVGTGISVTTRMTLRGADAQKYTLTQPGLSANITAKGLTVTGAAADNKVYDGTTDATITGGELVGVVTGDTVSLENATDGTFAQATVGTDISVASAMTLGGVSAANYSLTTQPTLDADITAKGLTVTGAAADNKVYDGTTDATITGGELSGVITGDTVSLENATDGTFVQATVGTDISVTSAMTLGGASAGNYSLAQPTLDANITAKVLTVSGAAADNKVYDGGTAATITGGELVGVVAGDTVSLENATDGTFAQAAVGTDISVTSAMTLGGVSSGNYSLTQPTLAADITAKGLTVSGAAADNKVYDGTTDATITGGELVGVVAGDTVSLENATDGTFAQATVGTDIPVTTAMTLGGTSSGNYSLTTQPTLDADITVKGLTVSGAAADNKVYDGTTDATITGGELVGVVAGDTVSLENATDGTFAQATVGTAISVTSAMTLGGTSSGNYSLTQPTLAADITAKDLTVSGAAADNKVYDGTTDATITGGELVGVVAGDTVSLENATDGTFVQATVGTDISVTSAMTLGGVSAGNYSLIQPTLDADITAKDLTVSGAVAQNKVYDGATDTTITGGELVGVVAGDTVSLENATDGTFAQATVGTDIPVTTAMTLGGTSSGNYSLTTQPTLDADITAKGLTVSGAVAQNKVYDGATDTTITGGELVGVVAGDTVSLENATNGTFAQATVGTDISVTSAMTLGGVSAGNYSLTQPTLDANITAKGLTVSGVAADNKVYDGTTDATITGGELVGVVAGDTVSLENATDGTFAQAPVGTDIAVTTAMTLGGVSSGNYSLAQPTLAADITAKDLTVSGAVAQNKVYDGATDATITGGGLVGVVAGDTVSLENATDGTFAQATVGTDIPVTTAMTLGGTSSGNYSLTTQPTLAADITVKGLTVTGAVADNKVYDGTTDATITGGELSGVITGDTVSLENATNGTFAQASVGTDIAVTTAMTISGIDADNYSLTQPTLDADITGKALTITADNKTRHCTQPNPLLTCSYEGFLAGENEDDLSTLPELSTAAVADSLTGEYTIVFATNAVAPNYDITQVDGTLTITNTTPVLTSLAWTGSVPENSAVDTSVGAAHTATDSDTEIEGAAEVLTYSITDGTGTFTIGESTGQISVASSTNLDYESQDGSIQVTVTVTDVYGAFASREFTVTLIDVNEAPVAAADSAETTEDISVSKDVIANDTDVDAEEILSLKSGTAAISSMTLDSDSSAITVDTAQVTEAGNEITFDPGTDFDFLAAGETATVVIAYTVTDDDAEPLTDDGTLTVTVTGVNDAPVLAAAEPELTTLTGQEDAWPAYTVADVLGGSVSDVDNLAVEGMAIYAADQTRGRWEYQLSATGRTGEEPEWTPLPDVSEEAALLLCPGDRIRFVPTTVALYDATFTYLAWDQTDDRTAGETADVAGSGGTSAFSTGSDVCTVSVEPVPYKVEFQAGTGGTLEGTVQQEVYWPLATDAVTAVADEGYAFSHWYTVSGQARIADEKSESTTVSPYADSVVEAVFTTLIPQEYELTMVAGTGGTVSPSGVLSVVENKPMVITATPDDGWQFSFWKLDGYAEVKDPFLVSTTMYVTGVATVQGVFKATESYATLTVADVDGGTSDPAAGSHEKVVGSTFAISAQPGDRMLFDYWVVSGAATVKDPRSASTTMTISGAAGLKPVFRTDPATINTLTIQAPAADAGVINPSPGEYRLKDGEIFEISAVPNDGYHFKNWSVNGPAEIADPVSPKTSIVLLGDAGVAAVFEAQVGTVELKVHCDPEEGGTTNPGAVVYTLDEGESMAFTAVPAAGMQFVEWIVDGPASLSSSELPDTRITVEDDCRLTAVFAEIIETVTMTVDHVVLDTDNSAYAGDSDCCTVPGAGTHEVSPGEVQYLTAIPAAGFEFLHWVISGKGEVADPALPETSVVLLDDATVTGRFRKSGEATVDLALAASPAGSGTLNPGAGTYTLAAGSAMQVNAMAAEGWYFRNWQSDGDVDIADPFGSSTRVSARTDATLTAVFEESSGQAELTISSAEGGTTNPGSGVHAVNLGERFAVEACPEDGYAFTRWILSGDGEIGSAVLARTSLVLKGNAALSPVFTKIEAESVLSITVQVAGSRGPGESAGGMTNPGTGLYGIGVGESVEIGAIPDPGWHFVNWTVVQGEVRIADIYAAETVVTVLDDAVAPEIGALFALDVATTTVTVSVTGSGTTGCGVGERSFTVGEPVRMVAIPAAGWLFDSWTLVLGNATLTSPLTGETHLIAADTGPVEVTANFVEAGADEYQLTISTSAAGAGALTPGIGTRTLSDGTWTVLTTQAADGYVFNGWAADGGAEVENPSAAATRVRLNGADGGVMALFTAEAALDRINDAIADSDVSDAEKGQFLADLQTVAGAVYVAGLADGYIAELEKAQDVDEPGTVEDIVAAVNEGLKTVVVRVCSNWNLLGCPYTGCIPSEVFGAALTGDVFSYIDGEYAVLQTGSAFEPGYGYWLCLTGLPAAGVQYVLAGVEVPEDAKNLPIEEGWNLLSMYDVPAEQRVPADSEGRFAEVWKYVAGHPFRWDAVKQQYVNEDGTLELGYGYWGYLVDYDAQVEADFTDTPFAYNWDTGELTVRLSGTFESIRLGIWDSTADGVAQVETSLVPAAEGDHYTVSIVPDVSLIAGHSYYLQVVPVRPGIRGKVTSARFRLPDAGGIGITELNRYLEEALTTATVSWNGTECTVTMEDAPSRNFIEYTLMKRSAGSSTYELIEESKLTMIDSQNRLIVDVSGASSGDKVALSYRLTTNDGTPLSSWKTITKVID